MQQDIEQYVKENAILDEKVPHLVCSRLQLKNLQQQLQEKEEERLQLAEKLESTQLQQTLFFATLLAQQMTTPKVRDVTLISNNLGLPTTGAFEKYSEKRVAHKE